MDNFTDSHHILECKLTIKSVKSSDAGTYCCRVKSAASPEPLSTSTLLLVRDKPSDVFKIPANPTLTSTKSKRLAEGMRILMLLAPKGQQPRHPERPRTTTSPKAVCRLINHFCRCSMSRALVHSVLTALWRQYATRERPRPPLRRRPALFCRVAACATSTSRRGQCC